MKQYDEYRCVLPNYRDGRVYHIGDTLKLLPGTEYSGKCFVLEKAAPVEKPKKKKKSQEAKG
ncbi:MAG: hypothetical protein GX585_05915 [Clostridiales bacterium]|nr:hypothetical protein [Clostridiales bacterium]